MNDKPISASAKIVLDDEQIDKIKQGIMHELYVDATEIARGSIEQVLQTIYDGIVQSDTKIMILTLDRVKELAKAFGVSIKEVEK